MQRTKRQEMSQPAAKISHHLTGYCSRCMRERRTNSVINNLCAYWRIEAGFQKRRLAARLQTATSSPSGQSNTTPCTFMWTFLINITTECGVYTGISDSQVPKHVITGTKQRWRKEEMKEWAVLARRPEISCCCFSWFKRTVCGRYCHVATSVTRGSVCFTQY